MAPRGRFVEGCEVGALVSKEIPIFSISSSSSDGRAGANEGAAGKPTYLATPAMIDTSWL